MTVNVLSVSWGETTKNTPTPKVTTPNSAGSHHKLVTGPGCQQRSWTWFVPPRAETTGSRGSSAGVIPARGALRTAVIDRRCARDSDPLEAGLLALAASGGRDRDEFGEQPFDAPASSGR